MYVMGKTLWNRQLDFDSIQTEYFIAAYDKDGLLVSEYLSQLSELFQTLRTLNDQNRDRDEIEMCISKINSCIQDFNPIITRNLDNNDNCIRNSWEYLKVHQEICTKLAGINKAVLEGEKEKAAQLWDEIKLLVQEKEDELQSVLDVYLFISTLEKDIALLT